MGKEVHFHFLPLKWAGSQPARHKCSMGNHLHATEQLWISFSHVKGPEVRLAPLLCSRYLCCMSCLSHPWVHSTKVGAPFSPPGNCHKVFVRVFHLKLKCAEVLQGAQLQRWQTKWFGEQYRTICRYAS